jgi:hypothetical protein
MVPGKILYGDIQKAGSILPYIEVVVQISAL